MKIILGLIVLMVTTVTRVSYPIRCVQIGDSVIGTVTDCDVASDPLPFKWTTTLKLKKNIKWAGQDDISYIYSNPDQTIQGDCILATPLPGNYSKGAQIKIEQTCKSFDPPLVKGANLVVLAFYSHQETFDDVLMYNFPIPGYITGDEMQPQIIDGVRKEQILRKIKDGQLKPRNIKSE